MLIKIQQPLAERQHQLQVQLELEVCQWALLCPATGTGTPEHTGRALARFQLVWQAYSILNSAQLRRPSTSGAHIHSTCFRGSFCWRGHCHTPSPALPGPHCQWHCQWQPVPPPCKCRLWSPRLGVVYCSLAGADYELSDDQYLAHGGLRKPLAVLVLVTKMRLVLTPTAFDPAPRASRYHWQSDCQCVRPTSVLKPQAPHMERREAASLGPLGNDSSWIRCRSLCFA